MSPKRVTVQVGPLSLFFTNVNTEMKLAGHSHFAEVTLIFGRYGSRGFPAFAETYAVLQGWLTELTAKPLRDMTNEAVSEYLFEQLRERLGNARPEVITRWGGDWALEGLRLAVRGVPDRIGHADGFTVYTVEAP